jgi:hypothetical protein
MTHALVIAAILVVPLLLLFAAMGLVAAFIANELWGFIKRHG